MSGGNDLAMLATAARHSESSKLLPAYARDAIAAAARLVAAQADQLEELRRVVLLRADEVGELRREVLRLGAIVHKINAASDQLLASMGGDKSGAVLMSLSPQSLTFTRVEPDDVVRRLEQVGG